jgi:hypothetical protein
MDRRTEHIVRLRGGGVCEYCRPPQVISPLPFPLDHIIARQHGGKSTEDNLALSCPECNLHKGPNIASIDPATDEFTRLFHPRRDRWAEHFRWDGAVLAGTTAIGRATILVLAINRPEQVQLREHLMDAGLFPRDPVEPPTLEAPER